jgi:hypothetical protein
MLCEFFLCWCYKYLWINLFSFGDVNSVLVNSLPRRHYILRIWNVYILHVKDCLYGIEDHMLFIDNELIKALQTLSVVISSLNFLEEINCQRIRCSGWALLLICVILIVIGKKIWHPLWNHCQIFQAVFDFFTKIFLVNATYGKW